MPSLSTADHRMSPTRVGIPRDYNAAHDLIERWWIGEIDLTQFARQFGTHRAEQAQRVETRLGLFDQV